MGVNMRKYVVLNYLPYELNRQMSDILENIFFLSNNWRSYAAANLPILIKNAWQRFNNELSGINQESDVNKSELSLTLTGINMHFVDSFNLSGPVVNTLEFKIGDDRHIVKIWTAKGFGYDPKLREYGLIKRSGVRDRRALVVSVVTKDTYEETWDRLYKLFDSMGLKSEIDYHVEAIYELED